MRQLRMVVWLALAAVALSGCFRYQSRIVVNADGSGIVREILVIDRTMLASGAGGQPAGDSLLPRAAELALPPWVAVRDYAAGDFQGVAMDIAFDGPEQFNERLNTLHRLLAVLMDSPAMSTVDLQQRDDGWSFTMRTADLAEVPSLNLSDPPPPAIYHRGELLLALTLPGHLVEHNADQQIDDELIWHLSAQSVQTHFYAQSVTSTRPAATTNGGTALQIATAVAAASGLALFAVVALSRRQPRHANAATTATPTGPRSTAGGVAAGPGRQLGEVRPVEPGPPSAWPAHPPPGPPTPTSPPQAGPGQSHAEPAPPH